MPQLLGSSERCHVSLRSSLYLSFLTVRSQQECCRPQIVSSSLVMQIDVLKAGWCKIGEKDGAKAIADLILFNTTLTTLDLRGNGLSNPGHTQLSYISSTWTVLTHMIKQPDVTLHLLTSPVLRAGAFCWDPSSGPHAARLSSDPCLRQCSTVSSDIFP